MPFFLIGIHSEVSMQKRKKEEKVIQTKSIKVYDLLGLCWDNLEFFFEKM